MINKEDASVREGKKESEGKDCREENILHTRITSKFARCTRIINRVILRI
jgi:hypothetical protein